MTTKEKIDQALGISCGKSMDQMLDELNIDAEEVTDTLGKLDSTAIAAFEQIDKKAEELQKGVGNGLLAMSDMKSALAEVEDIIRDARTVFKHIADNITGSDLIDSELVSSYSHLCESLHLNIAEFISIYKQKAKFVEKVKLMVLQQQQRIELAELRHKQNLELIEAKKKEIENVNSQDGEGIEFDTDAIMKSLSKSGAFDFSGIKQEPACFEETAEDVITDDEEGEEDDEDDDNDDAPKKKKK